MMKKLFLIFFIFALTSCGDDEFEDLEFNVPNESNIPVILSNTFQRGPDGELEEVAGPWFFLNFTINNQLEEDIELVVIRLTIVSAVSTGNFELFFLNAALEPTVRLLPSGDSFTPGQAPIVFGFAGNEDPDSSNFDQLLGAAFNIEVELIGYTLDEDGLADKNLNKRVFLTGVAN